MNKKDFNKKTFIVTAYKTNEDKIAFLSSPIIRELIRDKKLIHFYKSFGQWINDNGTEMLEKGFFIELKNNITYDRFLEIAENIRIYLKQECVTFQYNDNLGNIDSLQRGLLYHLDYNSYLNYQDAKIDFFNDVIIGVNSLKYDCFTIIQAQKLIFSFKF